MASMLSGSVIGFVWYYTLQEATDIHTFFAALVVSSIAMIAVSLMTKEPPQEVVDLVHYAAEFEDLDIKENTKEAAVKISALKFAQLLEEKM